MGPLSCHLMAVISISLGYDVTIWFCLGQMESKTFTTGYCLNLLIQLELSSLVQGARSTNDYITQLNGLQEELHIYKPLPNCICGKSTCKALANSADVTQADEIFRFLMGLNESFNDIRGQIIMQSPILAWSRCH